MASQTYHGNEPLTYSSKTALETGLIVRVQLRQRTVLAIVLRAVPKPKFAVKPILTAAPYPPLPQQQIALLTWLRAYYPAPLGTIVRQFMPPTTSLKTYGEASSDPGGSKPPQPLDTLPKITDGQRQALDRINGPGTFVLHGVTGSGKSRVYLELTARTISEGASALVLTPEIGLSAQLSEQFRQVFGGIVFVLHSQLTAAERRTIYYRLLEHQAPSIVIGPRSALFAPLRKIGLIVLDEAHDKAYKNESAPHYQTARVAAKLASFHDATLVLGSATPAVEDYYLAQAKHRPIITMPDLAKPAGTPLAIHVIDMKKPGLFARNRIVSDALIKHIGASMERCEQSLVFLNRRGTANVVLCNNCGWQALCSNCDLSLTYHGDAHELRCHVCGISARLPGDCPVCHAADILFKSIGTKAVVAALQKLFPSARIKRFDTDVDKPDRLEQQLTALGSSADIIVGTQMIGKGLDLPKLSVVGIVQADSSLLIPDYTAAEQTYQLIAQVIGRVGRGHRPGTVIVQTYDPDNRTLQSALHGGWQRFYTDELHERKTYRFPPFVHLLKLRVLRASSASAQKAALTLEESLKQQYPHASIEGPAPTFHPREHGKYSWQLLIKSAERSALLAIIRNLPAGWQYDIDPVNLL